MTMQDRKNMLQVEHLDVHYPTLGVPNRAVNDVSFSVRGGEVVGIVGDSGSGKSTAALAVLGLTRFPGEIVGGSVILDGQSMLELDDDQWRPVRGGRIGLVTQNPRGALSPLATVGDQICDVYQAHHPGASRADARSAAQGLLTRVGINDPTRRMEAFPHELSGGMAQRVVIAMSLSGDPELLIADEPTSGLDVTVQAQILDDMANAVAEAGSALLIVTQDLAIVANYCDRVYMMHAGEIVESAPMSVLFDAPRHPASVALMAAQRRVVSDRVRLTGFSVDGRDLPEGCWLQHRCPFANDEAGCRSVHPPLDAVEPDHAVRCHRHAEVRAVGQQVVTGTTDPLTLTYALDET